MRLKTETIVGLFFLCALALLIYLSIFFGVWRFNSSQYDTYIIFSHDCSGLMKKAEVKIAGVKVGFVEHIEFNSDLHKVHIIIKVGKQYHVYDDARAVMRQEGLLGNKYIELMPGNPLLARLEPGKIITVPQTQGASVEEVLSEIHQVTREMREVSSVFKNSMVNAQTQGANVLQILQETMVHVAKLAKNLEAFMDQNQYHVQELLHDTKALTVNIKNLSQHVSQDMMPLIEDVLDPLENIVGHISAGKGSIGKLIHDDELYDTAKETTTTIKSYLHLFDDMVFVFDAHTESLHGVGKSSEHFKNNKDYFNIRLHPCADYFYLVGLLMSQYGKVNRHETFKTIDVCEKDNDEHITEKFAKRKLNAILVNAQFGKIYKNFALRFGIIESTPGIGFDCEVPGPDWLRWVSTFEIFDFTGRNRLCGCQPHLKWLNRMFITDHIYFDWGFDDFASPENKTAFFGAGLRFENTDFRDFANRCIGTNYPIELG